MSLVSILSFSTLPFSYSADSMGLHRVENMSNSDGAISMHLYIPPYDTCKIFDQNTGKETIARVTYFTQFGRRTPFGAVG